jgi:hypothetical protein
MDKKNTTTSDNKRTKGASFKFDPNVFWQLQYVSLMEQQSQTDILEEALKDYFTRWEKKNGNIPPQKK